MFEEEIEKSALRRSKMEMSCDVLRVISRGTRRPTRIMQRANLTWRSLMMYLGILIKNDFVTSEVIGKTVVYNLTQRGREALTHYDALAESLSVLNLDSLNGEGFSKALNAQVGGGAGSIAKAGLIDSLKHKGFEILDREILGNSGIKHTFDVVAKSNQGTVHGYVMLESVDENQVISLFAKQLDTGAIVHAFYSESITSEAVRGARSYGIDLHNFNERQSGARAPPEDMLTVLSGSRALLEVDSFARYERGVTQIAEAFEAHGSFVHLFSWKGSPVYDVLSRYAWVKLHTMTPDVSYVKQVGPREFLVPQTDKAVLLDEFDKIARLPESNVLIIFDSISDMVVLHGIAGTYSFLKSASAVIGSRGATLVAIINQRSQDEKSESLIRSIFPKALAFDASGFKSARAG